MILFEELLLESSIQLQYRDVLQDMGSDDYERGDGEGHRLTAYIQNMPVGYIDYELQEGTIHIRWIEIKKDYKRNGIATNLWKHLHSRYPKLEWDTNGFTEDGERFIESIESKKIPSQYKHFAKVQLNERTVWYHNTTPANAKNILNHGFDVSKINTITKAIFLSEYPDKGYGKITLKVTLTTKPFTLKIESSENMSPEEGTQAIYCPDAAMLMVFDTAIITSVTRV